MDARQLALAFGRGRIAFGIAFALLPGLAGRAWIGDVARHGAVKAVVRGLGARDVALGLGVVIALDRGAPVRGWLEAAVLSDSADFLAALLAGDAMPETARRGTLAIAGASAVAGAFLARELDEPPAAEETDAPEAALTGHH